jgi:hypothetical protein
MRHPHAAYSINSALASAGDLTFVRSWFSGTKLGAPRAGLHVGFLTPFSTPSICFLQATGLTGGNPAPIPEQKEKLLQTHRAFIARISSVVVWPQAPR